MKVWKFELRPYMSTISMPRGATVLSAGAQGGGIFIWALCNPDNTPEPRSFVVAGTGHDIPVPLGRFVGTVFLDALVFHVWEAG